MRISRKINKFQEGGPMPQGAPEEGMAPEQGGPAGPQDPMGQILQVAAQALQTQNCEAAMAVCQALMQLAQGGAGGPEQAPQEEPQFARSGAKLIRIRRR